MIGIMSCERDRISYKQNENIRVCGSLETLLDWAEVEGFYFGDRACRIAL